jgi:ubiquinone/menaquinone biosynthesis C-methylase UbiE
MVVRPITGPGRQCWLLFLDPLLDPQRLEVRMPDDLGDALRYRVAPEVPVEDFDQDLADTARPGLLHELNQAALGDLAVPGLLTYSFVTRWDLDQAVASLNLGPGRLLLDLACGQGGPGLWLAERTGCGLVGVDFSEAGLQVARERAEGLLPGPRTRFQRGDLAATGLEDSSVDGVWCGDAFFFASDLVEALGEVRRVLRPGGRLVTTVCVSLDDQPSAHPLDWRPLLRQVGLRPLRQQETPHDREHATATYAAWIANEAELRAELPDRAVDELIDEARSVGGRLARMRRVLVVAER